MKGSYCGFRLETREATQASPSGGTEVIKTNLRHRGEEKGDRCRQIHPWEIIQRVGRGQNNNEICGWNKERRNYQRTRLFAVLFEPFKGSLLVPPLASPTDRSQLPRGTYHLSNTLSSFESRRAPLLKQERSRQGKVSRCTCLPLFIPPITRTSDTS